MVVTSITPCIKVTKENNIGGFDMYIELGEQVRITDFNDNVFSGRVLYFQLGKDMEEDDMVYLLLDNENEFSIGVSYIKDIDIL